MTSEISNPALLIRKIHGGDLEPTSELVRLAFVDNEPEETVAFLAALRADTCLLGEWLAENESGLVGHVAYSRTYVSSSDGRQIPAVILTPLAVHPNWQRQGVGIALVEESLAALEASGENLFLVLGHPAYYPRFGFSAAMAEGIVSPWSQSPGFMARGAAGVTGMLVLPWSFAEAH